jgi:PD-(D/E)XK nuclease superfamily
MRFGNGLAHGCARMVATMRSLPILSPSKPGFPTASELYRARECIAPWALGLPEDRETNEYAERGQRLHTFAAKLAVSLRGSVALNNWELCVAGAPNEDRDILENVYASLSIDASGANMSYWFVEQGIRYRPGYPDVAEFVERDPGQRFEGWFSGTADLVYVRADGVLVVADWKFGRADQVEPAEENCQLLFLALAFATALGITGSSDGVIVAHIELRFVDEDGVRVDGRDVTWGEMCAFADELGALAERIDAGAAPKISHACGKCPSKAHCPAWEQLELALYGEALQSATDMLLGPPRDAKRAQEYRNGIEALRRAREGLEERYRAFLVQNPDGVPLGLGMREVARKVERQNLITTEAAQATIRTKYGDGAFAAKPSLGRIRAVEKAKLTRPSKSDWSKRKEALDEELLEAGLLLPPSVHTRMVVQQIKKDKHGKDAWVDYRVDDDEEGED